MRAYACTRDRTSTRILASARLGVTASSVDVPAIVEHVKVLGARASAHRDPDGALRVAGLALGALPTAPSPPAEEETIEEESEATGAPFAFELRRLTVEPTALAFDDDALEPSVGVRATVSAEIEDLVFDPAREGAPATIGLNAAIEDALAVTLEGSAVPTGDVLSLRLEAAGSETTLGALAPYLAQAGLAPTLGNGSFGATIDASFRPGDEAVANLAIEGVNLRDGAHEHAAIDAIHVRDVRLMSDGAVAIGGVSLDGVRAGAELGADGAVRVLGLQTIQATATAGASPPATADSDGDGDVNAPDTDAAPADAGHLPRIELASFAWTSFCVWAAKSRVIWFLSDSNLSTIRSNLSSSALFVFCSFRCASNNRSYLAWTTKVCDAASAAGKNG